MRKRIPEADATDQTAGGRPATASHSRQPLRFDLALLALIAANLVPVFGVLRLDWDVGSIIVLYWAENLIVGGYTILRMLVAGRLRAIFPILFFAVHYGAFCAVHGIFVLELTGFASPQASATSWPFPLLLLERFIDLARTILQAAPQEFIWACLALVISHGASFLLIYIGQGEYRDKTANQLMTAPYRRIVVLHIAVIIGGFLVQEMGSPLGLLLALVGLKIIMDILLHNRSHNSTGNAQLAAGYGEQR